MPSCQSSLTATKYVTHNPSQYEKMETKKKKKTLASNHKSNNHTAEVNELTLIEARQPLRTVGGKEVVKMNPDPKLLIMSTSLADPTM